MRYLPLILLSSMSIMAQNKDTLQCIDAKMVGYSLAGGAVGAGSAYLIASSQKWNMRGTRFYTLLAGSIAATEFAGFWIGTREREAKGNLIVSSLGAVIGGGMTLFFLEHVTKKKKDDDDDYKRPLAIVTTPFWPTALIIGLYNQTCKKCVECHVSKNPVTIRGHLAWADGPLMQINASW